MVTVGNPWLLLSVHVSPCLCVCISQHTHIQRCQGSSWLFRVLHDRVQRHRGIFWLHLHVKWSALFCGREVPPDSPSPVACQAEAASSPHSSLPAGVGHDSTARNIFKVLSISSLPGWGQPSEEQQVGKDKHDPFTKTPLSQADRQKARRDIKKTHTGLRSIKCRDSNAPGTV